LQERLGIRIRKYKNNGIMLTVACIVVPFFAEKKEPKKPVENNHALFSTGSLDGAAVLL
jgi:hypothetical protein